MRSKIIPIPAFLPQAESIASLVCPPYDVVTVDEALHYAQQQDNLMHVIRAEVDADDPHGADPHSEATYALARRNLDRLLSGERYTASDPALYAYRIIERRPSGPHMQTGVVGLVRVDDYNEGDIKQHEKTKPDKLKDRTDLAEVLEGHVEPVLLAYQSRAELRDLLRDEVERTPLFEAQSELGTTHQLWRARQQEALGEQLAAIQRLYIADGHHRCAAASNLAKRLGWTPEAALETPQGASGYFPAACFPDDELTVFEYNWSGDPLKRPLSRYSMNDIIEIADRNGTMPPKSTWFSPKLISGMFLYLFKGRSQ